jgi:hypothetical protein
MRRFHERTITMTMHKSITPKRIERAARRQMFGTDNPGFCTACGHEQEGCEPDAQNYECDVCGERQVFGAQELLMAVAL